MQLYPNGTLVFQQALKDAHCEQWIRNWLRQNLGIEWPTDISFMQFAVTLLMLGGIVLLECRRKGRRGGKPEKDESALENANNQLLQQIKKNQTLQCRHEELEREHERVRQAFEQFRAERDAELEWYRNENQQLREELRLAQPEKYSGEPFDRSDSYVNKCLEDIDGVVQSTRMLEKGVREFRGSKNDKVYLHLKELLIRNTIKLDNIESEGHSRVREERKKALQYIHRCIDALEESLME